MIDEMYSLERALELAGRLLAGRETDIEVVQTAYPKIEELVIYQQRIEELRSYLQMNREVLEDSSE